MGNDAIAEKRRYPKRITNRTKYLEDYVTSDDINVTNCTFDLCYRKGNIPKNNRDAISCNLKLSWQAAMEDEMS